MHRSDDQLLSTRRDPTSQVAGVIQEYVAPRRVGDVVPAQRHPVAVGVARHQERGGFRQPGHRLLIVVGVGRGQFRDGLCGGVDQEQLDDASLKGILDSLEDPFSHYLTPKEASQFNESVSGEFEGVGMNV